MVGLSPNRSTNVLLWGYNGYIYGYAIPNSSTNGVYEDLLDTDRLWIGGVDQPQEGIGRRLYR